ncbi:hypothetical protein M4D57_18780 [Brevibacillus borstelensis]|uniref:hypothetical protein n=1 Tax=Brevibacillus borstelensis TaxID=45462 RepID=UPI00203B9C76|nr:hypothetical protein [Brevibacillus borstelensis]MCM3560614.1 hypothetical protein [Brevibacillus borstelensis]
MRKTVERLGVIDSLYQEAGKQMRMFLDGEILRDQFVGAIKVLFSLEIRYADINKEKHELAGISFTLKEHVEKSEPLEKTLSYVRQTLDSKPEIFGGCY